MEEDKVRGAVAICIDSSAGIRGVRSARCKETLNTYLAYSTALYGVTRNRSVSCWLFLMYFPPVVQTVMHLIHPIFFHFYPFHHFPFSSSLLFAFLTCVTMEFHCISQWRVFLSFTCIFRRCCLQYASVLQELFFRQWGGVFFCIPEQKRPLLVISVIKHTFTATRNTKLLHILCTITECFLRHYSPTVYYLLHCWFSIRKRTGFAGCVINYEVRSFGTLCSAEW